MIKKILTITCLLILLISIPLHAQTDHQILFEKAKYAMETKGDLKSAIDLFEQYIDKYSEESLYAARAQFYIGECYYKMGLENAEIAYKKVISNYPSEIEIVKLARQKLYTLEKSKKTIDSDRKDLELTQYWANPLDDMGMPSPDGRYFSFVNWNVPCLSIYDVETGETKDIESTKGTWEGDVEWAESSIWSPDGKKLAYVWYGDESIDKNKLLVSIRIAGIDSSEPIEVYRGDTVEYCHPGSWSSDNKYLYVVLCLNDNAHEIVKISVEDYSVESLLKLEDGGHPFPSLSPDENYIAYSYNRSEKSPNSDISIYSMKDGTAELIIDHPETDFIPLWSPSGDRIIFFSDRTGSVS
ncbi:MAG: tetratricopeptide repeat protein, partial [Melioribacteraceae bacterium]|nr:tetratricopeptide repeat protein [Melioribacteraceae bacterium]